MNKVILMGRLTRDAEVRYSQGENSTAIARFSLAVDRRFRRDGDEQTAILSTALHLAELQSFWRDSDVRELNSFWRDVFRPEATPTRTDSVYTRRTLLLRM